jgi:protein associated with RNAse G/E
MILLWSSEFTRVHAQGFIYFILATVCYSFKTEVLNYIDMDEVSIHLNKFKTMSF